MHDDFKKYIRLQNTASSCKHKVQCRGLLALGSLWDLKFFWQTKKDDNRFGAICKFTGKKPLFPD
ncbi:hypothetical protein A3D07_02455 [Candidatus Curtissbacteria bacterium RIFCSPHIGHO2_02_FULL_42_15]|uniref:Uncharacterized protein n=1 Tax=Candidatus Curtissbacteria bacterium RIFCSPHIGHO2_02_FULL_42_15 TaxID=1797716 RepID=A0A1F5GDS6_9BACT|nr:MAG: hypothetical protein A3D07_02455 [Candidatus Curtissbacteria bacterium RIFCSPHIGHO2_02_FULL_42_15]